MTQSATSGTRTPAIGDDGGWLDDVTAPHCSVPLTTPRMSLEQAGQLSAVFKALAHPTRVQLMNLLVGSPTAVCAYDLQVAMRLPQSTTSHHLKQLVTAGLAHRQQRGTWAYYSINRAAMRALGAVIDLNDGQEQPLSPAALRDPVADPSCPVAEAASR